MFRKDVVTSTCAELWWILIESDAEAAWIPIWPYRLRSHCKKSDLYLIYDHILKSELKKIGFHGICAVHIDMNKSDLSHLWANKSDLSHVWHAVSAEKKPGIAVMNNKQSSVITLSVQTNWGSSKLVERHFLSSFLALCFRALMYELNQRASLLWPIIFVVRGVTSLWNCSAINRIIKLYGSKV